MDRVRGSNSAAMREDPVAKRLCDLEAEFREVEKESCRADELGGSHA